MADQSYHEKWIALFERLSAGWLAAYERRTDFEYEREARIAAQQENRSDLQERRERRLATKKPPAGRKSVLR